MRSVGRISKGRGAPRFAKSRRRESDRIRPPLRTAAPPDGREYGPEPPASSYRPTLKRATPVAARSARRLRRSCRLLWSLRHALGVAQSPLRGRLAPLPGHAAHRVPHVSQGGLGRRVSPRIGAPRGAGIRERCVPQRSRPGLVADIRRSALRALPAFIPFLIFEEYMIRIAAPSFWVHWSIDAA